MASIYKRKNSDGTWVWRAVVRIKGYPSVCNHFERKQEAEDWAADVERNIRLGQFKFDQHKNQHTYAELMERYVQDGALEHHSSAKDTLRHLDYWKGRFGSHALIHLTSELIGKERQLLTETPSINGNLRSMATINRYISSLSATLTYAVRRLDWMKENPCLCLMKLKENKGRDRVLTEEEVDLLLTACKASRSSYLYCIVLIAITTGARQGEILKLEWQHVDFANNTAYLKETKNGRPRSVFLSALIMEELHRLYKRRQIHKPLVFASKTAFGSICIQKVWKKALRQASIHNFVFHGLRHCFATLAASLGASNLQMATAMGHRTLEMLQRYTHLDIQITQQFSQAISERIGGAHGKARIDHHEEPATAS